MIPQIQVTQKFQMLMTTNLNILTVYPSIIKLRKRPKVIRYVRFHKDKDPENYYREQIMLFSPWRSESQLLGECTTFHERYLQLEAQIKYKNNSYNNNSEVIDLAINQLEKELDSEDENNMYNSIAPNKEHTERLHTNEKTKSHNIIPSKETLETYDIGQDLGLSVNNFSTEELRIPYMPDEDYHSLVNTLNKKQKDFFYHTLHWCKTQTQPMYTFLTGGAGVGKSQVLRALYNALAKYYSSQPGTNPDDIQVLLMAPTGKAAHNIRGNTIHSTLQIPANQSFPIYTINI